MVGYLIDKSGVNGVKLLNPKTIYICVRDDQGGSLVSFIQMLWKKVKSITVLIPFLSSTLLRVDE